MRIGGIVAAVLREVGGEDADSDALLQLGHQQRGDHDVAYSDAAVRELKLTGDGFGQSLRHLNGRLLDLGGERQHVERIVVENREGCGSAAGAHEARHGVSQRPALVEGRVERV